MNNPSEIIFKSQAHRNSNAFLYEKIIKCIDILEEARKEMIKAKQKYYSSLLLQAFNFIISIPASYIGYHTLRNYTKNAYTALAAVQSTIEIANLLFSLKSTTAHASLLVHQANYISAGCPPLNSFSMSERCSLDFLGNFSEACHDINEELCQLFNGINNTHDDILKSELAKVLELKDSAEYVIKEFEKYFLPILPSILLVTYLGFSGYQLYAYKNRNAKIQHANHYLTDPIKINYLINVCDQLQIKFLDRPIQEVIDQLKQKAKELQDLRQICFTFFTAKEDLGLPNEVIGEISDHCFKSVGYNF